MSVSLTLIPDTLWSSITIFPLYNVFESRGRLLYNVFESRGRLLYNVFESRVRLLVSVSLTLVPDTLWSSITIFPLYNVLDYDMPTTDLLLSSSIKLSLISNDPSTFFILINIISLCKVSCISVTKSSYRKSFFNSVDVDE